MKRAFVIMIVFMFTLFLLNSLSLAEEAEKKPEEKAKVETKIEIKEMGEEPIKETKEKIERVEIRRTEQGDYKVEGIASRELFEMIRRQNDQIQQLREEIMRLRRLIEERLQPQVRRGEGEPSRRFEQDRPREEYQMREEQRYERPMDIDSEIRMLEDKVSRDPKNVDAHMRLAHLYDERGRIEAAISQYEMVTKIRPDFDPPYTALERLRGQRREREAQSSEEFNMGEVISSNMEEVTIKTLEGVTANFRVPRVRKDDGSWVPNMDIAQMAKSLDKGAKVKIFWNRVEDQKVIRRIEFLKMEKREEAKPMEDFNMGEVISSSIEAITIKTLEGETVTFKVPKVKKDDGAWVPNKEIGDKVSSLDKGTKVKIFWNKVEGEKIIKRIE